MGFESPHSRQNALPAELPRVGFEPTTLHTLDRMLDTPHSDTPHSRQNALPASGGTRTHDTPHSRQNTLPVHAHCMPYLPVLVVIMSDSLDAVDVVPDGLTEVCCIYIGLTPDTVRRRRDRGRRRRRERGGGGGGGGEIGEEEEGGGGGGGGGERGEER